MINRNHLTAYSLTPITIQVGTITNSYGYVGRVAQARNRVRVQLAGADVESEVVEDPVQRRRIEAQIEKFRDEAVCRVVELNIFFSIVDFLHAEFPCIREVNSNGALSFIAREVEVGAGGYRRCFVFEPERVMHLYVAAAAVRG